MESLSIAEIARIIGATPESLPDVCKSAIAELDFRVERIEGDERDRIFEEVEKVLASELEVAGIHRHKRWEEGWTENLEEFVHNGYDLDSLVPKFVRPDQPVRFNGGYYRTADPYFETNLVIVLRNWLFSRWFTDVEDVYEFGCGTSHNLVALAKLFPEKNLHGLDFTEASGKIIEALKEHHGFNIDGGLIDLFNPDPGLKLRPRSGIFTVGTLEQIGTKFDPFIELVMRSEPSVCINVETLWELYDNGDRFDDLARKYTDKRGYLHGLVDRLREHQKAGRIEILDLKRTFGPLFHEGYSYVVWRVCK